MLTVFLYVHAVGYIHLISMC